jgi:hypothetical protein
MTFRDSITRLPTLGFLGNNAPGFLGTEAKALLNMDLYSPRYSITKFDSALCRIARSRKLFAKIFSKSKLNSKILKGDD